MSERLNLDVMPVVASQGNQPTVKRPIDVGKIVSLKGNWSSSAAEKECGNRSHRMPLSKSNVPSELRPRHVIVDRLHCPTFVK
jgi:hypothetical protein